MSGVPAPIYFARSRPPCVYRAAEHWVRQARRQRSTR